MADVTITGLPNASTLTGTERVPMDQAAVTVDASTQAIANLATAASVGLGNVNNTSDLNKPISTATQAALDLKAAASAISNINNTSDLSKPISTATQAALDLKASLSAISNINNTSDLAKPISTATQAALDLKASSSTAAAIAARIDAFRDAATFYVSKRGTASDSNNGTSPGEPFLTVGAAVAAANAYITANPTALARIEVGPGTFTESSLPFRLKPNIYAKGAAQRGTILKPASGQEFNGFWAVDSGDMIECFRFAGHQASGTSSTNSSVGVRAWGVRFNEAANSGQGPIIYASPYVKDCASITAETDDGLAGSVSTGDTGGGIEVDGAKVHPSSPVRSMVVYGFTQQNLGGPGVVVKNDAYAELVSFFGLFCTWHVQAETGGWATLSGGGCSEFGTYGVVADGYSSTALYTGQLRVAASIGATSVDVVSLTSNRIGSSSRPHNGQIILIGGIGYVVVSSSPINSSGTVVADSDPTRAGYRVSLYSPTSSGLIAAAAQNAAADFRRRSQVSAGCHTALFVGSGTNYNALPWNGGVPVRANQFVERNFGRVFGLSVNDAGDISAAGGAFAVDGTSGSVTINTTSFNLSGLNAIGPFSRNGGISTVGVQIQEASNNVSLLSSTGAADGNTVPTQFAVSGYVAAQLTPYSTSAAIAAAYQPLNANLTGLAANNAAYYLSRANQTGTQAASTITGLGTAATTAATDYATAAQGAKADTAVQPAGLTSYVQTSDSRLTDSREWSAATIDQAEAEAGSSTTRRAFTAQRVFQAAAAWWAASSSKTKLDGIATGATANATDAQLRDRTTHTGTQAASTITGLATVATSGVYGDLSGRPGFATVATSGAYADLSGKPSLGTAAPLDVPVTGDATSAQVVKGSDTRLSDARTPTAHNQAASTITGLATVATSGAYTDLSGKPTLGTAAATAATDYATAAQGTDSREWSADTISQAEAEAGTATTRRAYTALRVFQAVAAWWGASASKTKLDGIASGATANSSDAQLRDRSTHTGTQAFSTLTGAPCEIGIACSDETTALTTGTAKVTFRMPYAMTLTAVRVNVNTAVTVAALEVNLKEAGTTVFSTTPKIAVGEKTSLAGLSTPGTINDSNLANDAEMTIDIVQAGGAAKGLKIWLIGTRA